LIILLINSQKNCGENSTPIKTGGGNKLLNRSTQNQTLCALQQGKQNIM